VTQVDVTARVYDREGSRNDRKNVRAFAAGVISVADQLRATGAGLPRFGYRVMAGLPQIQFGGLTTAAVTRGQLPVLTTAPLTPLEHQGG
jgi:hypothetical protein